MSVTRADAVDEVRAWIDTPFHEQAAIKSVGCDCVGLVRGVAIELGLLPRDFMQRPEVQPFVGYAQLPSDDGLLQRACDQFMQRIPFASAQFADVLLMRFDRRPQHVGILVPYAYGGFAIVHAMTEIGRVTEHRLSGEWRGRTIAAYRLPGIET